MHKHYAQFSQNTTQLCLRFILQFVYLIYYKFVLHYVHLEVVVHSIIMLQLQYFLLTNKCFCIEYCALILFSNQCFLIGITCPSFVSLKSINSISLKLYTLIDLIEWECVDKELLASRFVKLFIINAQPLFLYYANLT